jgi:hypothetical protein
MVLAGSILIASPAAAGSAPTELPLTEQTQPGFRYPGPFYDPETYIVYQRPTGSLVWNGRWYQYHEPHAYDGRSGYVVRRSY